MQSWNKKPTMMAEVREEGEVEEMGREEYSYNHHSKTKDSKKKVFKTSMFHLMQFQINTTPVQLSIVTKK